MEFVALNEHIALPVQDPVYDMTKYCELYQMDQQFLLLNLLSGAVDRLSPDAAHQVEGYLDSRNLAHLDAELLNYLIQRGYFADPEAEQVFIEELADRHRAQVRAKPVEFFVCTTYTCPVGCSYCFEGSLTTDARAVAVTNEQVDAMFDTMEHILLHQQKQVREIVLFGGESLLPITRRSVRYILKKAQEYQFPVTVCTSGIFAADFVEIFDAYPGVVTLVRITVDGPRAYHDSLRTLPRAFDRAMEGVGAMLSHGYRVMIRVNVGRQNIDALPELAQYFEDRGWFDQDGFEVIVTGIKDRTCMGDKSHVMREDELALRFLQMRQEYPVMQKVRPLNIFMSLRHVATNLGHLDGMVKLREAVVPLQTIRFHGCGALDGTLYAFGSDNQIYTCTEGIGKPVMSVGSYYPTLDLKRELLAKWQGWHKHAIPKCRECKYLLVCGGTCALTSVKLFGDASEPICPPIPSIMEGYLKGLAGQIEIM